MWWQNDAKCTLLPKLVNALYFHVIWQDIHKTTMWGWGPWANTGPVPWENGAKIKKPQG